MKSLILLLATVSIQACQDNVVQIKSAMLRNNMLFVEFCNNSRTSALVPFLHNRIDPENPKMLLDKYYYFKSDTLVIKLTEFLDSTIARVRTSKGEKWEGFTTKYVDKVLNPNDCFSDSVQLKGELPDIKYLILFYNDKAFQCGIRRENKFD